MCGIGGILRVWTPEQRELALRTPHGESIPEAWLDILDDSIKHRGPDGQGRFRDRAIRADGCVVDVAFVHRRLSIIDHAGGHQPMLSLGRGLGVVTGTKRLVLGEGLGLYERDAASELIGSGLSAGGLHGGPVLLHQQPIDQPANSDRVCVIFNGCIYNHRELRTELQRCGHAFGTDHSDTEVLVHGWREWGAKLFARLDGMWGWILWDAKSARLLFSRDRAGEKPLHIDPSLECASGVVAFSSAPAGLWSLRPRLGRENQPNVTGWLEWGFEEPNAGGSVQSSPPCCLAVIDESSGVFHWDYLHDKSAEPLSQSRQSSVALTAVAVDDLLDSSVQSRLLADVPVACFLSGGVDSGLIAEYAKRASREVYTFTVAMPDPRFDESEAAAATARALGTRHTTLPCQASPAEDLARLVVQLGQPLADSSLLPTYWLSRAVREQGFSVALGGDGGDELFGGYDRYRAAAWLMTYGWLLRLLPERGLSAGPPKSVGQRFGRLVRAAKEGGYPDLLRVFSIQDIMRLQGLDSRPNRSAFPSIFRVNDWYVGGDPRQYDYDHYLPFDLCAKVDTAGMSHALEARAPFLSRALTNAALGSPISAVMPHNQRKGLLRQVASKYLPAEIVDRPKMGFAIPIGEWFRSDYGGLRTILLDHLNSTEPFGPPSLGIDLNMKFVRQMLDEHLGTGPSGVVKRDHSQRLYMLLVLSIWAKWLGGLR